MSVISRTRPLDSFQHGLAEGIQIFHGANEVWSAANDIVGTLPLYFTSKSTKALKDYKLYGTSEGSGVETENLFDGVFPEYVYNQTRYRQIAVPNGDYTLWTNAPKTKGEKALIFLMGGYQTSGASTANDGVWENSPKTVNTQDGYITIAIHPYTDYDPRDYKITLVPGSTAPTSYIPPGYQLSLTVMSGQNTDTYPLYIGSTKLGAEEYVDYAEQKVHKKNPNYSFWTSAFVKYDDAGRVNIVAECDEVDKAALANNCGILSIQGTYENITHETEGAAVSTYTGKELYLSLRARDRGQGVTFRTFIGSNGNYIYGENFNITAAQVDASTDIYNGIPVAFLEGKKCIYENRPPVALPTDPPAPLPEIIAYEGENVLTSTETVGEVTLTGRLAKTYRQVEYLESTGTQYIDTGIVPTYSDAVETELQFGTTRDAAADKQGVLGTIYANRRFAVVVGITAEDPLPVYFYCGYPWQTPDTDIQITVSAATLAQKQKFVLSSAKIQLGSESKTPPAVSQSAPEKTFILFGIWAGDGQVQPFGGYNFMRCYGMTLTSGGSITHNLIPVERNSDGALGMLDTVTNVFYTNSGTGTFNKGSYVD